MDTKNSSALYVVIYRLNTQWVLGKNLEDGSLVTSTPPYWKQVEE